VTESVVLPAFDRRGQHVPIAAVGPINPLLVPGAVDWCYRRQLATLVIFSLVYLAGLRWPILIPGGK
jgi:hypothetical protein